MESSLRKTSFDQVVKESTVIGGRTLRERKPHQMMINSSSKSIKPQRSDNIIIVELVPNVEIVEEVIEKVQEMPPPATVESP